MSNVLRQDLYKMLKEDGYYSGSFSDFTANIDKPQMRRDLFDMLHEDGYFNGTWDEFDSNLTGDKKRYSVATNKGTQYFDSKEAADQYVKSHYNGNKTAQDKVQQASQATNVQPTGSMGTADNTSFDFQNSMLNAAMEERESRNTLMPFMDNYVKKSTNEVVTQDYGLEGAKNKIPKEEAEKQSWMTDKGKSYVADNTRYRLGQAYDAAHLDALYQKAVKPVYDKDMGDALDKASQETSSLSEHPTIPGMTGMGSAPMWSGEVQYNIAKYADPKRVVDGVMQSIRDDKSIGDYVLARMGYADTSSSKGSGESVPMTYEERMALNDLLSKHNSEVVQAIQQKLYREYINANMPQSDAEFILRNYVRSLLTQQINDAIISRCAKSSELRKQLLDQAFAESGDKAGWAARGLSGGLAMLTDAPYFELPSTFAYNLGSKVVGYGGKFLADKVVKVANKMGAKVVTSGMGNVSADMASRYLLNNSILARATANAFNGSVGFGTYGVMSEAARQGQSGKFDATQLLLTGMKEAGKGALFSLGGTATNELTKGLEGAAAFGGKVAGFTGEVALFTGVGGLEQAIAEGKSLSDVNWGEIALENAAMIGTMKATHLLNALDFVGMKERYNDAKRYGLDLNANDRKWLDEHGYDFSNSFSGLNSLGRLNGDVLKPEGLIDSGEASIYDGMRVTAADNYIKLMQSDAPINLKRKFRYYIEGDIASYEPVLGYQFNDNQDGTTNVEMYGVDGSLIDSFDINSNKATEYQKQIDKECTLNRYRAYSTLMASEQARNEIAHRVGRGLGLSPEDADYLLAPVDNGLEIEPESFNKAVVLADKVRAELNSRLEAYKALKDKCSADTGVDFDELFKTKKSSEFTDKEIDAINELNNRIASFIDSKISREDGFEYKEQLYLADKMKEQIDLDAQEEMSADEKRQAEFDMSAAKIELMTLEGGPELIDMFDKFTNKEISTEEWVDFLVSRDAKLYDKACEYMRLRTNYLAIEKNEAFQGNQAANEVKDDLTKYADEDGNYTTAIINSELWYVTSNKDGNLTIKRTVDGKEETIMVSDGAVDKDEDGNVLMETHNVNDTAEEARKAKEAEVKARNEHQKVHHENTPMVSDLDAALKDKTEIEATINGEYGNFVVVGTNTLPNGSRTFTFVPSADMVGETPNLSNNVVLTYEEFAATNDEYWDAVYPNKAANPVVETPVEEQPVRLESKAEPKEETPTTKEPEGNITFDEKGEPNFDKATADEIASYFSNEDDMISSQVIDYNVEQAKKAAEKAAKGMPKFNGGSIEEYKAKVAKFNEEKKAADDNLARWNDAKSKYQVLRADNAQYEQKGEEFNTEKMTLDQRDEQLGEPMTLQEFVERAAFNQRYKWNDKGNTKGLGAHIGGKGGERASLLRYLSNKDGVTPEEAAHTIAQQARESGFTNVDEGDVLNMINEAFLNYGGRSKMIEFYEGVHKKAAETENADADEFAPTEPSDASKQFDEAMKMALNLDEELVEDIVDVENDPLSGNFTLEDLEKAADEYAEQGTNVGMAEQSQQPTAQGDAPMGSEEPKDNNSGTPGVTETRGAQADSSQSGTDVSEGEPVANSKEEETAKFYAEESERMIHGDNYVGFYPFGTQINSVNVGKPKVQQIAFAKNMRTSADASTDFEDFYNRVKKGGEGYSTTFNQLKILEKIYNDYKSGKISAQEFENAFLAPDYKVKENKAEQTPTNETQPNGEPVAQTPTGERRTEKTKPSDVVIDKEGKVVKGKYGEYSIGDYNEIYENDEYRDATDEEIKQAVANDENNMLDEVGGIPSDWTYEGERESFEGVGGDIAYYPSFSVVRNGNTYSFIVDSDGKYHINTESTFYDYDLDEGDFSNGTFDSVDEIVNEVEAAKKRKALYDSLSKDEANALEIYKDKDKYGYRRNGERFFNVLNDIVNGKISKDDAIRKATEENMSYNRDILSEQAKEVIDKQSDKVKKAVLINFEEKLKESNRGLYANNKINPKGEDADKIHATKKELFFYQSLKKATKDNSFDVNIDAAQKAYDNAIAEHKERVEREKAESFDKAVVDTYYEYGNSIYKVVSKDEKKRTVTYVDITGYTGTSTTSNPYFVGGNSFTQEDIDKRAENAYIQEYNHYVDLFNKHPEVKDKKDDIKKSIKAYKSALKEIKKSKNPNPINISTHQAIIDVFESVLNNGVVPEPKKENKADILGKAQAIADNAAAEKSKQTNSDSKEKKTPTQLDLFDTTPENNASNTPEKQRKSELEKKLDKAKKGNADGTILFRVGDNYELYREDADKVSDILGLPKTKHESGMNMVSFPFEKLADYQQKLIDAGVRIGIYDDLAETKPTESKEQPKSYDVEDIINHEKEYNTLRDGETLAEYRKHASGGTNEATGMMYLVQKYGKDKIKSIVDKYPDVLLNESNVKEFAKDLFDIGITDMDEAAAMLVAMPMASRTAVMPLLDIVQAESKPKADISSSDAEMQRGRGEIEKMELTLDAARKLRDKIYKKGLGANSPYELGKLKALNEKIESLQKNEQIDKGIANGNRFGYIFTDSGRKQYRMDDLKAGTTRIITSEEYEYAKSHGGNIVTDAEEKDLADENEYKRLNDWFVSQYPHREVDELLASKKANNDTENVDKIERLRELMQSSRERLKRITSDGEAYKSKTETPVEAAESKSTEVTEKTEEVINDPVGAAIDVAKKVSVKPKIEGGNYVTEPITENPEDFGEKIGGARKDTAVSGVKKSKDGNSAPAWRKKYKFMAYPKHMEDGINAALATEKFQNITPSMIVQALLYGRTVDLSTIGENNIKEGERFIAYWEEEMKSPLGVRVKYHPIYSSDGKLSVFNSMDEVEAVIPVFEVQNENYKVKEIDGKFKIVRKASNGKDVVYATFDTKEEAAAYLVSPEGCKSLLSRKRNNFEIPGLENVTRNNMPDYRKGKNVTTQEFMDTFGFRGGEFGNWLNTEERQSALNVAYDSLMDLANVLGISPKALSLGGQMAIAFGARGQGSKIAGGSSAAAHYEPLRAVINLTKMNGAGCLAHEWAHALDNYFALQALNTDRKTASENFINRYYTDEPYGKGTRTEIHDAIVKITRAMTHKSVTKEYNIAESQEAYDKIEKSVRHDATLYRGEFKRGKRTRKYNRKTKEYEYTDIKPTEEDLKKYDELVEELIKSDDFKWTLFSKDGIPVEGVVARQLYELVKEIAPGKHGRYDTLHNIWFRMDKLIAAKRSLEKAKAGETFDAVVPSDYMKDSKFFDETRATSYWSTTIEMFARAFENYVMRKLNAEGKTSDYLSYNKGDVYKNIYGHNPFPSGEEAKELDKLFDNLFNTIQEKDGENGEKVLFRKKGISNAEFNPTKEFNAVYTIYTDSRFVEDRKTIRRIASQLAQMLDTNDKGTGYNAMLEPLTRIYDNNFARGWRNDYGWVYNQENSKYVYNGIKEPLMDYKKHLEELRDAETAKTWRKVFDGEIAEVDYALDYYKAAASGIDVTKDWEEPRFRRLPSMMTTFSGGGMIEVGMRGYVESKYAVEYDKKIAGVYADNHGHHIVCEDVTELDYDKLDEQVGGSIDVFHSSPVCHNYSGLKAGRVTEKDIANDIELAKSTARIINKYQPKVFTLENVPNYLGSEAFYEVWKVLENWGYKCDYNIIDSADYGAATSRKRLIVRAVKDADILPPLPAHREPTSWYERTQDLVNSLPKHDQFTNKQYEKLMSVEPNWENLDEPILIQGFNYGKAHISRMNEPAKTIVAGGSGEDFVILPGGDVREVTPRMLARLSGLPDDYLLPDNKTLAHKIIGNGVPVEVTRSIIAPLVEKAITDREKKNKVLDKVAKEYIDAVKAGDDDKVEDIFEKYCLEMADDNIVPFVYAKPYTKLRDREIANRIKGENLNGKPISKEAQMEAIRIAASEMANLVPKNAVIVPIPSHTGKATHNVMLAEELAKITGSEVADVLEGLPRQSNKERKDKTGKSLTPEQMGVHLVGDLPEGKRVIFVDNVVNHGATAAAAIRAVGRGKVVAYSYTMQTKQAIPLKFAFPVTYDSDGNIIPLTERLNALKNDVRFRVNYTINNGLYSNAERAVVEIKQDKATGEQWLNMLKNNGGLKSGEDKWIGLSDYLNEHKGESLTKEEVLDYVRKNAIEIKEVKYSENNIDSKQLSYLQSVYDGFYADAYEVTGSKASIDRRNWAYEQMVEMYGKNFREAFDVDNYRELVPKRDGLGNLVPDAEEFLSDGTKQINVVRAEYTTRGLDNKKEVVLTVPSVEPFQAHDDIHFGTDTNGKAIAWCRFGETTTTANGAKNEYYATTIADELEKKYGSSYALKTGEMSDEDLAKYVYSTMLVRGNTINDIDMTLDMIKVNGEKADVIRNSVEKLMEQSNQRVLVIDEIQSNRHQEGREKGYNTSLKYKKQYDDADNALSSFRDSMQEKYNTRLIVLHLSDDEKKEYERLRTAFRDASQKYGEELNKSGVVPDAPFDKNWMEVVAKRMVRYAVENGFDKIAWTSGAQQAKRYNIGGVVKDIYIYTDPHPAVGDDAAVKTIDFELNDMPHRLKVNSKGVIVSDKVIAHQQMYGKNLSEVFGKELADEIMSKPNGDSEINLEGREIGGEGMKTFYDKMLVNFMNKFGKKFGAKVGVVTLPNVESVGREMWSLDITDEMRKTAMEEGFAMFKANDESLRHKSQDVEYHTPEEMEEMATSTQDLADELNTPVVICRTPEEVDAITELSKANKEGLKSDGKAVYLTKSKKIVVYLPNNEDASDAMASVLHEVVGHKGLRRLVGEDEYKRFLANVYVSMPKEERSKLNKRALLEFGGDVYEAVDEILAEQAEKDETPTWWERVKSAFRQFLRKWLGKIGIKVRLNDDDLKYILWQSKNQLREGDIISEAEQRVMRSKLGINRKKKNANVEDKTLYRTSGQLDEEYPNWNKTQTTKKGGHSTQVTGTIGTYKKIGNWMQSNGMKDARILDASSGKGLGTLALREMGFNVDDVEPYAPNDRQEAPTFGSYDNINKEYDIIISNAVLNVIPDDWRADVLKNMAAHLAPGGKLIINTRGLSEAKSVKNKVELDDESEILVKKNENEYRSYQKFFTHDTLTKFIEDTLGEGYTIENATEANSGIANEQAVVVTKNDSKPTPPTGGDGEEVRFRKKGDGTDADDDTEYDPVLRSIEIANAIRQRNLREATEKKEEIAEENTERKDLRNTEMNVIISDAKSVESKVRRAMTLRKKYDQATVDSVVGFIKDLLKEGKLNGATASEVSQLLTAVNSANGKEDISKELTKVVDMVVRHQLSKLDDELNKLTRVKDVKVDNNGVVVQGKVGVRAQNTLSSYRNHLSLPEGSTYNDVLSDLQTRITDAKDDAVRDELTDMLMGAELAQQYAETIAASKAEEKSLKEEIKKAKQEYDNGDISHDDYLSTKAAIEDAIRENKLDRIDAMADMYGKLQVVIEEGAMDANSFLMAKQERVREIHHFANSDLKGVPKTSHRGGKDEELRDKLKRMYATALNNDIYQLFTYPLATFETILRRLGDKAPRGEGYLFEHFMRGWLDSRDSEITNFKNACKTLDAKVAEVYGNKKMTWTDLCDEVSKKDCIQVAFYDGSGEKVQRTLTQGNALYIYMVDKMLDGQMKLRKMGISESDVKYLKDNIDPKFIEIADWIQEEFLVDLRNRYNQVHKQLFGANMKAIENYVPLRINKNDINEDNDIARVELAGMMPSTKTGAIIKRTRNTLPLDILNTDGFDVIMEHIKEMEHWAAFAQLTEDFNNLISYKTFRNKVKNMNTAFGGTSLTATGKEKAIFWNKLLTHGQIALGAYRPKGKEQGIDRLAVNLVKAVTASKIAFRNFTALKQTLSFPAALPESNIHYVAADMVFPKPAFEWCMENLPIFQERWGSRFAGDTRLMPNDSDWNVWRKNSIKLAARYGMAANAFIDAVTCAIVAHPKYLTAKKYYLSKGMDEAMADHRAKQDATMSFNQSQQSSEMAFVNQMQVDRTALAAMLTNFRNSSMAYTRKVYVAAHDLRKRISDLGSTEFATKKYIRMGFDEASAKAAAKSDRNRAIWRDLADIAVFGFLMQFLWNMASNGYTLATTDDDELRERLVKEAASKAVVGTAEGFTMGNYISGTYDAVVNSDSISEFGERMRYNHLPEFPAVSDWEDVMNVISYDKYQGVYDLASWFIAAHTGVSPETVTDMVVAIMDATNGDIKTSQEIALALARANQIPTSNTDRYYFESLKDENGKIDPKKISQFANNYVEYQNNKQMPFLNKFYTGELKEKRLERLRKQFDKKLKRYAGEDAANINKWVKSYEKEYPNVLSNLESDDIVNIIMLNEEKKELSKKVSEFSDLKWSDEDKARQYAMQHQIELTRLAELSSSLSKINTISKAGQHGKRDMDETLKDIRDIIKEVR